MSKKAVQAVERGDAKSNIEKHFKAIMKCLNLDMTDPSLKNTPTRVAKMLVDETCASQFLEPPKMTMFPDPGNRSMVLVKDITLNSMCEHHFVPFIGVCHIAYIPNGQVIGLSKLPRTVQYFSAKPQIQERLTKEIAEFLKQTLDTDDVAVVISAKHLCCSTRGAKDPNSFTVTSSINGVFENAPVRSELFSLINSIK